MMFFGVFEAYLIFRFSFELKVNNQKKIFVALATRQKGAFSNVFGFL